MPNTTVHVTKAADLKQSGGQTDGMIRKVLPAPFFPRIALSYKLIFSRELFQFKGSIFFGFLILTKRKIKGAITHLSPSICASLMTALPHSASAVHHHGAQDTIVY